MQGPNPRLELSEIDLSTRVSIDDSEDHAQVDVLVADVALNFGLCIVSHVLVLDVLVDFELLLAIERAEARLVDVRHFDSTVG